MTTSRDLIGIAEAEVGVTEQPPGSNTGPRVRAFQAVTELGGTGWPWCAAFIEWCLERAGLPTSWCSPSTDVMWKRAQKRGLVVAAPSPGCVIIWPGVHVGLVVAVHANGTVSTIEGNSGDMVARRVRAVGGARFIRPPGLTVAGATTRVFWLSDPAARRLTSVVGPWRTLKAARRAQAKLSPARRRRSHLKRTGNGRFVLTLGPEPRYGPWADKASRDQARARLEAALGRPLRPYSTTAKTAPTPAAEAMGKTT